ncbi:C2 calcium-dependent domain-containing protein 4C-like [Mantella aurantiaca]
MWLLEKLKVPDTPGHVCDLTIRGGAMKPRPVPCPNILTPDRIPEFFIPPLLSSPRGGRLTSGSRSAPDLGGANDAIQVDSADEPMEDENTNADPQAQAALSLPHLPKAHTSYGFCTLLESPNTRRKESLFHEDLSSLPAFLSRPRSLTCQMATSCSLPCQRATSCSLPCQRATSYSSLQTWKLRALSRSGTLDSETSSSTDSSPFSSPLLHRPPSRGASLLKSISQDRLFSRALRRKAKFSRNNSLSADEFSSADSSPGVLRRVSDGMVDSAFPMDLLYSRGGLAAENTVFLENGAALRLSAEYCTAAQRLRVRLISIEGLYSAHADPKTINCSVTFSITPGKQQKQRSTVIRRSRNPIFNEDFYFEDLPLTALHSSNLKIKAINKGCAMRRDSVLGQSELPLLSILSM